ncbi:hypothetical protein FRC02_009484 [Tulasnella sp. 418]|nr:hypothetical protein FRC02_009484 [Tulasnella sp. 418]
MPPDFLGVLDYIPAGLAGAALIKDAYSLIATRFFRTSQSIEDWNFHSLAGLVRILFSEFLQLEDLGELDIEHAKICSSKWKSVLLAGSGMIAATLLAFLASFSAIDEGFTRQFLALTMLSVAWLYMSIRIVVRPPRTPPYILLAFGITTLVISLIRCWNEKHLSIAEVINAVAALIVIAVAGMYPLLDVLPGHHVAQPGNIPSDKFSSPEDSINLWQWSTFVFMNPLLKLANIQTLNEENVWKYSPFFLHRNLFSKYLRIEKTKRHTSLLRFLLWSNSLDLIIASTLDLYKAIAGFVPPYCLQKILAALESHDPKRRPEAYFYGLVVFVFHMSFAQLDLFGAWHARRCYERTRGQMFCALHWKALKRRDMRGKTSGKAKHDGSTSESDYTDEEEEKKETTADIGRVVNLMQGDSYAVAQRFWEFSGVFISPIRLVIALVFLYRILGWSCFAGVGVVLFAYAINYPLAMKNVQITKLSWAARDKRMAIVDEFFQSIRFLKYMGWESHWSDRVRNARETEIKLRIRQNVVDTIISFIWTWIPSAVILVSFLSYTVLAEQRLTVSKAFTSIEVFSQLQGPMTELPGQIFALLHAFVSMRRMEQFLAEDEVEDWATSLKRDTNESASSTPSEQPARVGFGNATFEWHATDSSATSIEDHSAFRLTNISVDFPIGKLSLITGPTGSGKSSLFNALLGEMTCLSGTVYLDKSKRHVAYAAQLPWLEHATIRDNILFRSPYNAARYNAVLDACALRRDLEIFEAGDLTEIGEKGVSLSGGQRARVALARAVYSYAKVVLLDDPLAAVDMHTARHLVYECFAGPLMKGRTVLLVTHHVNLCLPVASYILEISDGKVLRQGSVGDLEAKGQLEELIAEEDEDQDSIDQKDQDETPTIQNEADMTGPLSTDKAAAGKLVEAEHRAEGRVSLSTYLTYIRAAGWFSWLLTLLLALTIRGINIGNQFFLANWAQAYGSPSNSSSNSIMALLHQSSVPYRPELPSFSKLPNPNENVKPWLIIFTLISLSGATTVVLYFALGYWSSIRASRLLFTAMLDRVSRAPSSFFDKTPIGRILNRFTSDIGAVDFALFMSARNAMSGTLAFLASFAVIVLVIPRFSPFALAIAMVYIVLAPPYVKASRDLRRLESISLSPAFSGFNELLHGLTHIRAFGVEMKYQDRFYAIVDKFQCMDHWYWNCSYWMKYRYDILGSIIVYFTTLFALYGGVSEGMAALVIVNAGVFAEASRQLVRVFAQLELDFNSIERIGEYLQVEQEAPAKSATPPPAYWPSSSGGIAVEDLVIKYAPHLPQVLKGVSFEIKPREKVGVVGRTGSGKAIPAL